MKKNPLFALRKAGTAVWLDQLSRELLQSGRLQTLRDDDALSGVTSNPAIFHKAMTSGTAYESQIKELRRETLTPEQLYEHLAVSDIQIACDILRPVWEQTKGADGFVSLEVSPHLAEDTAGTIREARRLWAELDRPNVFIKVPGTAKGLPAIRQGILSE